MKFNLKNKQTFINTLLGNIDQLDISYYMQQNNESGATVSGTSNLLLCFNKTLLDILYKFDQQNAEFQSDQTESGDHICKNIDIEFIKNNLLKIEIDQDFIRSFSFKKSEFVCSTNCGTGNSNVDFMSVHPQMFLDYENTNLDGILTKPEQQTVVNSKLLGVTINDSNWIAKDDKKASRSYKLPTNIRYFSILNSKLNYNTTTLDITMSDGTKVPVQVYVDENMAEDIYSTKNKAFTVINDSTISLKFLLYVDTGNFQYLLDKNDNNINYHINVSVDNTIAATGNYSLVLYEKASLNKFPVNKIVYIKNVYEDEIIAIGKVINLTNNTLLLESVQSSSLSPIVLLNMDEIVLYKTYDLTSFKNASKYDLFKTLISQNLITFSNIIFDVTDFKIINELY